MTRRLAPGALVLLLALALTPAATAVQPAFQVKDIGMTVAQTLPLARFGAARLGGTAFFIASDEIHGSELWQSDGTAAGTHLVKDLCPGSCSGVSGSLVPASGFLYFAGTYDAAPTLFRTDGTAAGTVPTFPAPSPLGQKGFTPLAELGGSLLLLTRNVALGQLELWRSDGSVAGTSLVKSLGPIPTIFPFTGPLLLGSTGSTVFFSYDDGSHGRELWKTDGTATGTGLVLDISPGSDGSIFSPLLETGPQDLPVVAGSLLFAACEPTHGCQLWKSDGTAGGTVRVADVNPFPGNSRIPLAAWNGGAVFLAHGGLWKTDGTAVGTLDIGPDPGSSPLTSPKDLVVAGSEIFFSGCGGSGCSLWKSDGTSGGTAQVASLSAIPAFGLDTVGTNALTAVGSKVVYWNDDGVHGLEPWVSDGTVAGTALLSDIVPGSASSYTDLEHDPQILTTGVSWLIPAQTSAGWELWGSDGTPAGTASLAPLDTQTPSLPRSFQVNDDQFFAVGDRALFGALNFELWASDGSAAGTTSLGFQVDPQLMTRFAGFAFFAQQSLWKTDGTAAGTTLVFDGGASGLAVTNQVVLGDSLYFTASDAQHVQLWKSDGTPAGTTLVHDVPTPGLYDVRWIASAGNRLFFIAAGSTAGDLWVSDGSAAGTAPLVVPGQTASFFAPTTLTQAESRLFFFAHGTELWTSDGTAGGTALLHSFSALDGAAVAVGSRLFFLADDGVHGRELWTSDGSAAGTHMVADILPGAPGAFPELARQFVYPVPTFLSALFGRVYFAADDGVHGRELWVSDGTAAGTHMVADLVPGAGSSLPANLAAIGHLLFFAATDGVHSVEPWVSDGTGAGTRMLQDIAPGDLPSSPDGFAAAGPYVYFAANDGTHGFEPWALPRAGLGGFLQATMTVAGHSWEGGTVTYTLTVTNVGAGPHPDNPGDEVSDTLPAGLTLLTVSAGSGTVEADLPNNRVTWNGALDPGASVTITIQAQVADGTFGTPLANQATLSFDADGDGANESTGVSDDPGQPGAADATVFTPATSALSFYTVTPCRVVDTRGGAALASGAVRTLAIAGSCGVPAGARAVAANLTIVGPTGPGFLTLYPAGRAAPLASTINFSAGQIRANNAVLPLSGGQLDVFAFLLGNGHVDLLLDVVGYDQ